MDYFNVLGICLTYIWDGYLRGGRIVEFYSIYKLGANLRKQLLHKSMFKLGAYEGEPTRVTTVGDSVAEHYYGHSPSQRGQATHPLRNIGTHLAHSQLYFLLMTKVILSIAGENS